MKQSGHPRMCRESMFNKCTHFPREELYHWLAASPESALLYVIFLPTFCIKIPQFSQFLRISYCDVAIKTADGTLKVTVFEHEFNPELQEVQTTPQIFAWRQMKNCNGQSTIVLERVFLKFMLPENK